MSKTIIAEGRTTAEAIEKGLNELKVAKSKVDIKILENEDKRSFFDILAPRVVKVQLTLKESINLEKKNEKEERTEEIEDTIKKIEEFIKKFIEKADLKNVDYKLNKEKDKVFITITGENASCLIGYRGEVLNSLQNILTSIANKKAVSKVTIVLDVEGYREKRKKVLENLAEKMAASVIKKQKKVVLEPMTAYERKIIHSKLQTNKNVETHSIGEEPYRKVVIELKK